MTALLDAPAIFATCEPVPAPVDDLLPRCPHCAIPVRDDLRHYLRDEKRWLCPPETPPAPLPPALTYLLAVLGCPRCGTAMVHQASGVVIGCTDTSVMVRCPRCSTRNEYQVAVHLIPFRVETEPGARVSAQCGTEAGYMTHIRVYQDTPCADCRKAHSEAEKVRQTRRQERGGKR